MQTTPAYQAFRSTKYFDSLDGIRAISILGVIWHHTISAYFLDIPLIHNGHFGVSLFFVISGFLITTLLLRERFSTGRISIKNFMIRRSLRIFPLYYTVLGVYVISVYLFEKDPIASTGFWHNLPFFLTYTSNLFVQKTEGRVVFFFAWSLAVEEQFYLLWSWVEKLASSRMILFTIALVLGGLIYLQNDSFISILLGVIIGHALDKERSFSILYSVFGRPFSALIAAVILVGILSIYAHNYVVFFAMAAFICTCVIREDHALQRILSTPILKSIGAASYGMYLFHLLSYRAVELIFSKLHIANHIAIFGVSLIATYVLALLSHKYYESRFLRLKSIMLRS